MTSRYSAGVRLLGDGVATDAGVVDEVVDAAGLVEDLARSPRGHRVVLGDVELDEARPRRRPASAIIACNLSLRDVARTVPYTRWPCRARWMAVARPMPELAPVTTETGRRSWRDSTSRSTGAVSGTMRVAQVGDPVVGAAPAGVGVLAGVVGVLAGRRVRAEELHRALLGVQRRAARRPSARRRCGRRRRSRSSSRRARRALVGRLSRLDRLIRRAANSWRIEIRLPGSSARWYTTIAVRSWPVGAGMPSRATTTKRVWLPGGRRCRRRAPSSP